VPPLTRLLKSVHLRTDWIPFKLALEHPVPRHKPICGTPSPAGPCWPTESRNADPHGCHLNGGPLGRRTFSRAAPIFNALTAAEKKKKTITVHFSFDAFDETLTRSRNKTDSSPCGVCTLFFPNWPKALRQKKPADIVYLYPIPNPRARGDARGPASRSAPRVGHRPQAGGHNHRLDSPARPPGGARSRTAGLSIGWQSGGASETQVPLWACLECDDAGRGG